MYSDIVRIRQHKCKHAKTKPKQKREREEERREERRRERERERERREKREERGERRSTHTRTHTHSLSRLPVFIVVLTSGRCVLALFLEARPQRHNHGPVVAQVKLGWPILAAVTSTGNRGSACVCACARASVRVRVC